MKQTKFIRVASFLFAFLFSLATLTGCAKEEASEDVAALAQTLIEERNSLQSQLDAANAELTTLKSAPTPEPITETVEVEKTVPADYVIGVDCTLNGADRVMLDGETTVTAVATPSEGYVFDRWLINGEVKEGDAEASFTFSSNATVQAVCVLEHTLTCVNCHFQFLDDKGNAKGDELTAFNFEEDYQNPVTGATVEGGKITGVVTADVPKKMEIDGWFINGVEYEPNNTVKSFLVTELDEQTVYEVKLVEASTKYYKVTCSGCTFSGGGYTNATSGKVKYGTKITITGGLSGTWGGSGKTGHAESYPSPCTQTYTVKKNCSFSWKSAVN